MWGTLCVQNPPPLLVYRNENLQWSTWIEESSIAVVCNSTQKFLLECSTFVCSVPANEEGEKEKKHTLGKKMVRIK